MSTSRTSVGKPVLDSSAATFTSSEPATTPAASARLSIQQKPGSRPVNQAGCRPSDLVGRSVLEEMPVGGRKESTLRNSRSVLATPRFARTRATTSTL
jgi:hypothetical protein